MFLGWNAAKVGRESHANELFQSAINLFSTYESKGKIDSYEPILLGAHGGNLNGFFLIKGSEKSLDEVRNSDEFVKLVVQGTYVLDGFGVVSGYAGQELQNMMQQWQSLIS
jgi:hypothetical protein